ncbi:hypothetical protein [Nannocystis radixulma]|uniref:Uncharacterized protein n=1 Tax=Nannocystis radixulma TaxID=2995305 RepID=A0ABT5BNP8_9BACT|nr:hypothetical protein [Nannocystis radixulma]MDC0675796.1 hypothetical protein [Nannocystis radixulma]
MTPVRLRRQIVMLVEKDGQTFVAHWIEYPLQHGTRTHLAVHAHERTLLPRTGIGVRLQESRYDVQQAAVRGWLESMGYRVVGELAAES